MLRLKRFWMLSVLAIVTSAAVGPALAAPFGLDPGDVIVADYYYLGGYHSKLLRVDPSGSAITTLAASETSILREPDCVVQDTDGSLLVPDGQAPPNGGLLRSSPSSGSLSLLLSGGDLSGTGGVAFDAGGDLILTNPFAIGGATPGAIYRVNRGTGAEQRIAAADQGAGYARRIVAESGSNFLFIDSYDHRLRRIDAASGATSIVADDPRLQDPQDVARLDDGTVYVLTIARLMRLTPDGVLSVVTSSALFNHPISMAVSRHGGPIYVGNFGDGAVVRVSPTGAQSYLLSPGTAHVPYGLAVIEEAALPVSPTTWGKLKDQYRH